MLSASVARNNKVTVLGLLLTLGTLTERLLPAPERFSIEDAASEIRQEYVVN